MLRDTGFGIGSEKNIQNFAGRIKEISKENYVAYGKGGLLDNLGHNQPNVAVFGLFPIYNFYPDNVEKLFSDTVYPLANEQGYGTTKFYREALGQSAIVISLVWKGLVIRK